MSEAYNSNIVLSQQRKLRERSEPFNNTGNIERKGAYHYLQIAGVTSVSTSAVQPCPVRAPMLVCALFLEKIVEIISITSGCGWFRSNRPSGNSWYEKKISRFSSNLVPIEKIFRLLYSTTTAMKQLLPHIQADSELFLQPESLYSCRTRSFQANFGQNIWPHVNTLIMLNSLPKVKIPNGDKVSCKGILSMLEPKSKPNPKPEL